MDLKKVQKLFNACSTAKGIQGKLGIKNDKAPELFGGH
jgi:hypothetical protein